MSGWSAQTIRRVHEHNSIYGKPLIRPWSEGGKTAHGRSYGLTCAGYDVCLKDGMWLWPFYGRLGVTVEHISLPDYVRAELKDKSTNARLFVTVQNTILEPGWHGHLTLELTRHRPWPIWLPAGTPIGQLVFTGLDEPTEKPYGAGKYQGQPNTPVPAILVPAGRP